jgi:hypothetical protein
MRPKSILSRKPLGAFLGVVSAAVVLLGLWATFFVAKPTAQSAPAKGKVETYNYFVFADAMEGQETEFNRWYDHQHAPDVVAVPGFVTAQRYVAADPQLRNSPLPSKYLVVYKVVTDDLAAVQAEVSRRLATKMTVMSPTFKGASNAPSGYYKTISPMIPHRGDQPLKPKGKADTYYQFVFSNPVPGTSENEFNTWYEKTHAVEVVSSPNWIEAQRGQLMNPRVRPGQTTYNYLVAFRIVTDNLASTWDAYRQRSAPMTKGPLGENVGYTYKELGPLIYGDQVRAERTKPSK